ncbi:MAG: ABC transporter permease [Saccharofermentanales bacterium]
MRFAFRMAARFLRHSRGQTILIILGIGIGISVQIFISALIGGLQKNLVETTIGRSSHITITNADKSKSIADYQAVLDDIADLGLDVKVAAPSVTLPAFIRFNDKTEQVFVRGFVLEQSEAIYKFNDTVKQGTFDLQYGEVAIGTAIAEEYGISAGDEIEIVNAAGQAMTVTVTTIFDFKVSAINRQWLITNDVLAKEIFDIPQADATSIEIQIDRPFDSTLLMGEIKAILPPDLKITDWQSENQQLLSGLNGQSISSNMIQAFVIISVVLAIASVLSITVLQKSKQLGILKAMGVDDLTAAGIFLWEGFLLGLLGGIAGIAIGVGLLQAFATFALNADGTPVVPVNIDLTLIAFSGAMAILSAMAAALIPSIKSRKLSPMEVIRNG